MSRLTRLTRSMLDPEQAALFDRIANGEVEGKRPRFRRRGADDALEGPFNARLLSPAVGGALYDLATATRQRSALSDRMIEIVILCVAAAERSRYQLRAHEDIARAVGLRDEEVAAARAGDGSAFADPAEQAALDVARALLARADLADEEYAAAVTVLGERRLFEVVTLTGFYQQSAMQIRVFRVEPPPAA
jgi:4-carboxymuconolactone decarboxylase